MPGSARRQTLRGRPFETDTPRGWSLVVDVDDRRVLDDAERRFGPLNKRHGIGFYVVLELEHVALFDPLQAVEVHVVDDHTSAVLESFVAAGELVGRARHPVGDTERSGRGPHECGFAGADLSGEHYDVTWPEHPCHPGCQHFEHSLLQAIELHGRPWNSTRAPAGPAPARRRGSG